MEQVGQWRVRLRPKRSNSEFPSLLVVSMLAFLSSLYLLPQKESKYYSRDEFCVVREQSGREEVKCQLERALEKEYGLVIVDPSWLGDQAIRY